MSDKRKHKLVDCNPSWVTEQGSGGDIVTRYILFDCPEGHEGCRKCIPFTPSLEGETLESPQANHAHWQRTGSTVETLTLSPSIRTTPRYPNREAAIAAGCIPEYIEECMFCAMHIFIKNGAIEFCGDSK